MVNLLFISSNSKIDTIKNALQPLLKVKIDIADDFDYGLKEVFEKRPASVFIQDQIAGVTGESVARHIQMLLGSAAPSFIFMHNGNLKAKPIKGLYEFLIDLSQDDTKVLADIQSTLKLLIGPQWQKIYVPPKANKSVVMATPAVPVEDRVIADQLVDDFISGLETVSLSFNNESLLPDVAEPDFSTEESFQVVSSTHDQVQKILATTVSELKHKETASATVSDSGIKKVSVTSEAAMSSVYPASAATSQNVPKPAAHDVAAVSDKTSSAPASSPENESSATAPIRADMPKKSPSLSISPADFRIGRDAAPAESVAEDVLKDAEGNYRSKSLGWRQFKVIAVLLLLCVVGSYWYLVDQKSYRPSFMVKTSPPAVVPASVEKRVATSSVDQKPLPVIQKDAETTLPSFIPLAGHDPTFTAQKPGWERYVGTDSEFRLFRSAGKLKAVQVLATKGHVISEPRLNTILTELTGTGEYRITSREQKLGFQVSHATVNRKTELLIYRKKTAVHAFVVSLD